MKRYIIFGVAGTVLLAPVVALAEEIEDISEPTRDETAPADERPGHTAQPVSEEAESEEGILNITTEPKHAEISLDRIFIGVSPISELAVEVGEHVVKAERAGHCVLEARVVVETGEIKELHMELVERRDKPESWWGKYGMYFSIAGIVLAAGLIIAIASIGPPPDSFPATKGPPREALFR
jgi:hypothetical protein